MKIIIKAIDEMELLPENEAEEAILKYWNNEKLLIVPVNLSYKTRMTTEDFERIPFPPQADGVEKLSIEIQDIETIIKLRTPKNDK